MPTNRINGHRRPEQPADRMPPCNLFAEMASIGSALIDADARDELASMVAPEDYFREAHAVVWRTMLRMADAGQPVDTVTLAETLQRDGQYERIGGDDLIAELIGSVPHGLNWAEYGAIVVADAQARRLIAAADQTLRESYDRSRNVDDLVAEAEASIFAVGARSLRSEVVRGGEAARAARHAIQARIDGAFAGIRTGWREIDDITHGLGPGSVTVVGARPSMGKTAFALALAEKAAIVQGKATLCFSLEMGAVELGERLIASVSRVPGDRIKTGSLSAEDVECIDVAVQAIDDSPLWIEDTPARTVQQIAAISRRIAARARHNGDELSLVVIDYAQLIGTDPGSSRENREQQIAKVSRETKNLARQLGVPIVLLAQLNRLVETRADQTPRMSDLRESGSLEQDADFVILLHRPEYYDPAKRPGEIDVIIAKNRNGRTKTIPMAFLKPTGRFEPLHRGPGDGHPF